MGDKTGVAWMFRRFLGPIERRLCDGRAVIFLTNGVVGRLCAMILGVPGHDPSTLQAYESPKAPAMLADLDADEKAARVEIPLSALLAWSSRRIPRHDGVEEEFGDYSATRDNQKIVVGEWKVEVNRYLVRECLQPMIEARLDGPVKVSLHSHSGGCLRLECGGIVAVAMLLMPGADHGDDQFPWPEVSRG